MVRLQIPRVAGQIAGRDAGQIASQIAGRMVNAMAAGLVALVLTTSCTATAEVAAIPFEPTSEFVREVGKRMMMTPHRFEVFMIVDDDTVPLVGDAPIITGEWDGEWTSTVMDQREIFAAFGESVDGDVSFNLMSNGAQAYVYAPVYANAAGFGQFLLPGDPLEPAAEEWVFIDGSQLVDKLEGYTDTLPFGEASTAEALAVMEVATDVVEGPPSQIRGVDTRTIEATVNFGDLMEAQASDTGSEIDVPEFLSEQMRDRNFELEIHVDSAGLLRRFSRFDRSAEIRIDFIDIGEDVVIDLPKDAVDITSDLARAAEAAEQEAARRPQAGQVPPTAPSPPPLPTPDPATAAAAAAVLRNYPDATVELIGQVAVLGGEVPDLASKARLDAAIRDLGLGVQNNVLVAEELHPFDGFSIIDLIEAQPELSQLMSLIEEVGLVAALDDPDDGPFTILAPTNDAFAAMDEDVSDWTQTRQGQFLSGHVLNGSLDSATLGAEQTFVAITGEQVMFEFDRNRLVINGSIFVLVGDIEAHNGMIHVIASVIEP